MVYKVAYFTRTNTSKRVAEKIATALSCPCIQITDDKNWKGLFGYIKAGFYSSVHKSVAIEVHGTVEDADETIFVAPLWAGGLAPAAIAFLESIPREKCTWLWCRWEAMSRIELGSNPSMTSRTRRAMRIS